MYPEHGSSRLPLPSPVAIVMTPDQPTYTRGQSIRVQLKGIEPDYRFTGFLIQARTSGGNLPYGTWIGGAQGQAVGCRDPKLETFPAGNDTAAHVQGTSRHTQELVFITPDIPGRYHLELTTVERFGVFWMYQFSPMFSVV
jgi:hypothetical protein